MKATGIVRRIDDLGRVVVPKEIRRNLGIKEGDPLEIFVTDDGVCFVPYRRDVSQILNAALNQIDAIYYEEGEKSERFSKNIISSKRKELALANSFYIL